MVAAFFFVPSATLAAAVALLHRWTSFEDGKGALAPLHVRHATPTLCPNSIMLPSPASGPLATHAVGIRWPWQHVLGGDGWINPMHHSPNRGYGKDRKNVADVLRPSAGRSTPRGGSRSPTKLEGLLIEALHSAAPSCRMQLLPAQLWADLPSSSDHRFISCLLLYTPG